MAASDIRLVLTDLDDTFLARDKSLPEVNRVALDLLSERGVVFVPCTGRPVAGIPERFMHHPATRYGVSSNGGVVVDALTGEVLHRSVMPIELVCRVYERVRDLNVTFDVFVANHVLAERARYDAMASFEGIDKANLDTIRSLREPSDIPMPERLKPYDGAEKVTLYWGDVASRDAAAAVLAQFPEIEVTTSHPRNFEFMAAGTSKGSALVWICGHMGCEPSAAVAFGDSANDIPMLEAAGDGVAVANAGPDVQAAADHVCESCDDGGVGRYLLQLLA
ncbi:MAG: HAD-IIB family hydrolase [Coriobacteriales bacterium]|nr:HAD-IIB family hydrolase [Coriobacteriales bacterium]MDO5708611.1 HAD-IIB family hydrolase [Coriobacteriales bacterium]